MLGGTFCLIALKEPLNDPLVDPCRTVRIDPRNEFPLDPLNDPLSEPLLFLNEGGRTGATPGTPTIYKIYSKQYLQILTISKTTHRGLWCDWH